MLTPEILASDEYKTAVASAVSEATSPLQTSLTNLESNNRNLLSEKKQLEGDFNGFKSKFEGIDIDAMRTRLSEVDNDETRALLAQGEFDKVYEKQIAQKDADHQAQLEAASKESADSKALAHTLQRTLVSTVRDGGISQAFVAKQADSSLLTPVHAMAQMSVELDGEMVSVVSVGTDGKSVFRDSKTGKILQNAEGNFNYGDWLVHLAENEGLRLFAKPNSHSSKSVSESNPQGFVKSKMTTAEKKQFKTDHGIPAYNALPFS